jgi:multisubunit Na+/H+ antiporter MnhB subunit
MAWIRYSLYFLLVAVITAMLTQLEIAYPGSLRLQVFADEADLLGTSEFSPIEMIQPLILIVCGLLMAWVATNFISQRPVAFPFGGMALAFTIRELDYFFDLYLIDNLWQVLIAIAGALVIVYTYRQRKRLNIALARLWPSPGLVLLFAGAVILFLFVRLVGHEPLWQAIMGEHYQRVVKLAVEEFIELIGYLFWLIGTIEYTYQVRSMSASDPIPAAVKRRQTQRKAGP